MNTQLLEHKDLLHKKAVLAQIKIQLKENFIGLDQVIDEVMNLVGAWYLFPDAQLRPTVINLWGLTGSGKTALIKKLVELLAHEKLFAMFDMGEFESDSASWFKNILTNDLEYFHEKPGIICLDEFQFARTIGKNGDELGKDKLRVIWDLLDSGKISYIPGGHSYYIGRVEALFFRIQKAMERGVILSNGIITHNEDIFLQIFYGFYFEDESRGGTPLTKEYFLSNDFTEGLYYLNSGNDLSRELIKDKLAKASFEDIVLMVENGLKTRIATKQMDLTQCLIFVLGNLDEAYYMSYSINPDISADDLHKATQKITIAHIKEALQKRFRNEQIARLGNNHVIYKSFSKSHFVLFIKNELERVKQFVSHRFGFTVNFDDSVIDIIYNEGVFPAQGTRPVLTTIKNLVECFISKIVVEMMEKQLTVATVDWAFKEEHFFIKFKDSEGEILHSFKDEVVLKTEKLRQTSNLDIQAHTAVHEAGHGVLAALTLRLLPSVIVSKSASNSCDGFCMVTQPEDLVTRETIRSNIIISLGGYVAEKMIFGLHNTSSGVEGDIQDATAEANKAIKQYAMGKDPVLIALESGDNENAFFHHEQYVDEAMQLIKACEIEAFEILSRNKLLLLKIAEYLTIHPRMEEETIGAFVKQYSVEEWVRTEGFKNKKHYFDFHQSIKSQLQELETALVL